MLPFEWCGLEQRVFHGLYEQTAGLGWYLSSGTQAAVDPTALMGDKGLNYDRRFQTGESSTA